MTLIGYTDKRGNAWHYRSEDQGNEPNHYPGAIPVDDVLRRLFDWKVIEAPITYIVPGKVEGAIVSYQHEGEWFSVLSSQVGRKGMLTDDTYYDLGAFKSGYQGHDYTEWLIDNVATILDTSKNGLGIGSAGLLKNRAQAWVSVEMEENFTSKQGVEFRPYLLAATSFDGSIAT
jgi:hypothetical protein